MMMDQPWLGFEDFSLPASLSGNVTCDYLIVGGGLTGLSIAYHLLKLAQKGKSITIIDAKWPGFGASAKSSGMIGPGVGLQFHLLTKKHGEHAARMMFIETQKAVKYATNEILNFKLNCDLNVGKQIKVAKDCYSASRLKLERESLIKAGFDVPCLTGKALQNQLGTKLYQYALQYNGTATVNPMKLVQSLIYRITELGGKVFFNTPANLNNIDIISKRHTLKAGQGSIKFKKLILATNGFSREQGVQENRVIPISTSMIMSNILTKSQLSNLGLIANTAVIESSRLFNYFRLTEDRRLLFGGSTPCYSKEKVAHDAPKWKPDIKIYRQLRKKFRQIFPKVDSFSFPYQWSGTIGATLDNFPVVSASNDKSVDTIVGWCGHGLAMSMLYGKRYADLQFGNDINSFPWMRSKAPYLAPAGLLAPVTNGYISYMSTLDKFESVLG